MADEVWDALCECDGNKTPRPDGFNLNFIRFNWEVVKKYFLGFMNEFHVDGSVVKSENRNFIALVSKDQNPVSIKDYRLIILVRAAYKILAKVLANRLKKMMDKLISSFSNDFGESKADCRQFCDSWGGYLSILPTYYMSVFGVPSGVSNIIEKLKRDFFWNDGIKKKKVHVVDWVSICKSKWLGDLRIGRIKDIICWRNEFGTLERSTLLCGRRFCVRKDKGELVDSTVYLFLWLSYVPPVALWFKNCGTGCKKDSTILLLDVKGRCVDSQLSKIKVPGISRPPMDHDLVFNVDGSAKEYSGLAGIGGVMCDANGKVLCLFSACLGVGDSIMAEVLGIHRACALISSDMFFLERNITILSDSKSTISRIKGEGFGHLRLVNWVYDIRQFLLSMNKVFNLKDLNRVFEVFTYALFLVACSSFFDVVALVLVYALGGFVCAVWCLAVCVQS
ncbi:hypothetical protein Ddye_009558 [Dipteronia dyeriana]|uniref:RNase H type-1 domain-containing protein n=1 Tax=Dipteronia dyeriana TaxID=168575 RepID=A0AAD9XBK8_9ROSI|nr:hypothetical protein Ddye_009558 [Dipteronia dyeriana]